MGWYCRLGLEGITTSGVTLDGLDGAWATGNHQMSPTKMKHLLPQNVTLSYDLVASQNFTWGAKG